MEKLNTRKIMSTALPDGYKESRTDQEFNNWSYGIREAIVKEFHPKAKRLIRRKSA